LIIGLTKQQNKEKVKFGDKIFLLLTKMTTILMEKKRKGRRGNESGDGTKRDCKQYKD